MAPVVAQVAISVFLSLAIGVAQKELARSSEKERAGNDVSPAPEPANPLLSQPEPGGSLPGIFGRRRVGGPVALSAKSGDESFLAIVIAGAPVTGFAGVYIDNALATIDGSGDVVSAPWVAPDGSKAINVKLYDGTQLAADPELAAAFPGWTAADHIGYQIAYARIRMSAAANPTYFNELLARTPDFTFDVLGFKCYDPRNGAHDLGNVATYSYSENVSICRANYFIHALGMGKPASLVDWASVAAAANIDDEAVPLKGGGTERRHGCAAYWRTDERHEDVLSRFNAANGGAFAPIGDKWRSTSGNFGTVTAAITSDDYAGDVTFSDHAGIGETFNGVRGKFTSPLHNYEMRDFPPYQDGTALASDAAAQGVSTAAAATWLDLSYDFVTSHTQAQRLARTAFLKSRYGHSADVELQFTHFDTVAGDFVTVTDPSIGWTAKTFKVTGDSLAPDWSVRLRLEHETAAFYAWTAATDEKDFNADDPLLGEPGGLLAPGFALVDTVAPGGTIVPNFRLWPSPSSGWDTFVVLRVGSPETLFPKDNTITNFTTAFNAAAGVSWSVKVRNTATGEESPTVATPVGTVAGAVVDASVTTTTVFELPAAPAPRVKSAHSGLARLALFAVNAERSTSLLVYSSATNDTGTATLANTLSNADQDLTVSGTQGTVRYYWTRAHNAAAGKFGPFSRALAVVF